MPLSVAEALRSLPILSEARVVAGENGLQREIRWTHIIDKAKMLSWVREGDLLLTNAYTLKGSQGTELGMIRQMAEKGFAGMLVSIGGYIREVPPEMLREADEYDFPIITTPWNVSLDEITHAVHEKIISQQYALNEQVYHIHRVLTNLVLQGGGLQELAVCLKKLVNRSVTIENAFLQLQAYASVEPIDEIRRRTINEGVSPKEFVDYIREYGVFERLRNEPKPQHIPPVPELGLTLERLIAPILVGEDLYGYIWIIETNNPLTRLDYLAIEQAAYVAALIISREQSSYLAEKRIKVKLLESLMDSRGRQDEDELVRIVKELGLSGEYRIMLLEPDQSSPAILHQLSQIIEKEFTRRDEQVYVFEWDTQVITILELEAESELSGIFAVLQRLFSGGGYHLKIGVSAPLDDVRQIRQSYLEAREALQVGRRIGSTGGLVWEYEKLGYLSWLAKMESGQGQSNAYFNLVKDISGYDEENDSDYLETLDAYLICGLDSKKPPG